MYVLGLCLSLGLWGCIMEEPQERESWADRYRDPALVGHWSLIGSRLYWNSRLIKDITDSDQISRWMVHQYYFDAQGKMRAKDGEDNHGDYYVDLGSASIVCRYYGPSGPISDRETSLSYELRGDSLIIASKDTLDAAPYAYYLYYTRR